MTSHDTNITYQWLSTRSLQPGRFQPRVRFEQKAMHELAKSILDQGMIEPIIVREVAPLRYEIIAGERRWRAAQLAGFDKVPCLIGVYSDAKACALTLVENIQRQELSLIEEAHGYRRLCDEFHFHQDEIAALVSKSRSHIANILRLLTLCPQVQEAIGDGQLSLGHARLLVGMPPLQQSGLLEQIVAKGWSVRMLETKVRKLKDNLTTEPLSPDRDIQHLERTLAEQIGAPVQIVAEKGQSGWLQVKFFDNETLAGLLERMGLRYD